MKDPALSVLCQMIRFQEKLIAGGAILQARSGVEAAEYMLKQLKDIIRDEIEKPLIRQAAILEHGELAQSDGLNDKDAKELMQELVILLRLMDPEKSAEIAIKEAGAMLFSGMEAS